MVVLAVIGILIGLLLPAVQAAREAARRIHCQNNLRQTGLSLLNFESVHRVFPASGWTKPGPGNPSGSYLSWRVMCLGFVEQLNAAAQYDKRQHWWIATNLEAGKFAVATFACPSTPNGHPVLSAIAKPPRPSLLLSQPLFSSDYEAVMGVNTLIASTKYDANNRFSVMHRNSTTKFAQILDGSSNTVMVLETAARPSVYRRGGRRAELANDQGIGWIDSESAYTLDGASADGSREGCGPDSGCSVAINARNDNEPYSFHAGGANGLFADGHVAFESESVALLVLAAECTRAAGE